MNLSDPCKIDRWIWGQFCSEVLPAVALSIGRALDLKQDPATGQLPLFCFLFVKVVVKRLKEVNRIE